MFKICGKCGKAFEVDDKDRYERKRKYCGIECAEAVKSERIRAYSKAHRKPPKSVICAICGKSFLTSRPHQVTCSPECNYERSKALARESAHKKTKKYLAELAAMREPEPKPQPREQKRVEQIPDFNEKAREMGLSYGQYDAYLRMQAMRKERAKHG